MSFQLSSGLRSKPLATGLPPRHKIVVAIDYGTTYSGMCHDHNPSFSLLISLGVSYGSNNTQNSDSIIYAPWSSRYGQETRKVPTRIAYERENVALTTDRCGFEAEPKYLSCSWTKLLLDKNAVMDEEDDITSKKNIDEGMMRLPPHRNAPEVCEDFLRGMYNAFAADAKETLGVDAFKMTPLDCWITLPAIWSDEAKEATLNAAREAGFAKNSMDEIHTIAEPEAAAISTLKELAAPGTLNAVQSGDNIMICDCGGGTVDITTYTITSVVPKIEFKELCIGTGGKCGSTYIDRHLHALLSERFGDAFDAIPPTRKGPGSKFMNAWEWLKKDFGNDMENPSMLELGPLYLNLPNSHLYDNDENVVYLSHEDMQLLFDPIVNQIMKLVQKQTEQAYKQKKAKIHRIVLVGGLGSSKYLHYKLRSWCSSNSNNIELLCPKSPETAVLRGAAIRALEDIAPCLKYARRHYGFKIGRRFRENIDDEKHAYIDDYTNEKYCSGRVLWCVSKGDEIIQGLYHPKGCASLYNPGEAIKSTIRLYACDGDQQPYRVDDPGKFPILRPIHDIEYIPYSKRSAGVRMVGEIPYEFTSDFNFDIHSDSRFNPRLNKMVHRFIFQVQVIFGDRGANLKAQIAVGGRLISDTTIYFPDL
ncbi:hypothetical protein EAF04_007436 [Stromatinia cepivora]|nr:hypothetical protein EAF04_007436 [Stromatinia cepivora]